MDRKRVGLKDSYMWNNIIDGSKPKFGIPPRDPAEDPNDPPVRFTANPTEGADPFNKRAEEEGADKGVMPHGA